MSDFFGSHAPRDFSSSLSLPSEGQMEVGGLGMPLCCFPRVFLSSRSTWSSGRGGGASGCALVHANSLLSPRFIREMGIQELLSCDGLLLPVLSRLVLPRRLCTLGEVLGGESLGVFALFSVASFASSLHARRGGGAGGPAESRSS